VCLLTDNNNNKPTIIRSHIVIIADDNNNKPIIIRPHIVFTDGRQKPQTNHNTTTYCVYWQDDNNDKPNHNTTTYCVYWRMITTTNPTMIPVWPYIVLTYRRQKRQPQPHVVFTGGRQQQHICWVHWRTTTTTNPPQYNHILCLLTDDYNGKSNHNTTTYCVYWRMITTTNRYDHALCLLTDDKSDNPNHTT
jgi:hypothetical protein